MSRSFLIVLLACIVLANLHLAAPIDNESVESKNPLGGALRAPQQNGSKRQRQDSSDTPDSPPPRRQPVTIPARQEPRGTK